MVGILNRSWIGKTKGSKMGNPKRALIAYLSNRIWLNRSRSIHAAPSVPKPTSTPKQKPIVKPCQDPPDYSPWEPIIKNQTVNRKTARPQTIPIDNAKAMMFIFTIISFLLNKTIMCISVKANLSAQYNKFSFYYE